MPAPEARGAIGGRARHRIRRIVATPAGAIGTALTTLVVSVALLADVIAPRDPFAPDGLALQAPSRAHPMGTDDLGRDVFSGVIHGSRTSLLLALGVVVLVAIVGLMVGLIAGYYGGLVDDVLMRATEAFQVLPRFFLAIVVIALFGPGLDRLVLVLGLTSWTIVARVVRAETLSLRELDFVEAARALGAGDAAILRSHVLPAVVPAMTTFVALMAAQAIVIEASLGFLGLSDPSVMSWGILAGNAQRFLRVAWWLAVFPGGAIAIAVLGVNLLGDGITAASGSAPGPGGMSRPRPTADGDEIERVRLEASHGAL